MQPWGTLRGRESGPGPQLALQVLSGWGRCFPAYLCPSEGLSPTLLIMGESESHSVVSVDCTGQNSPGQNTGVGTFSLLQGNLLNLGIKPGSPTLQVDSLPAEPQGKPKNTGEGSLSLLQQIFPIQESNLGLMHCRRLLYPTELSPPPRPTGLQGNSPAPCVSELPHQHWLVLFPVLLLPPTAPSLPHFWYPVLF